ncbi:tetraacyldisaccharide 4'-kinase [Myxococcota bacterium]|nr:tetraacyldisaccharide 4'-kinase [Myxococcota bacterium]
MRGRLGARALLSAPYRWGASVRGRVSPGEARSLGLPTVAVGNLHFGGSAKTPMAAWLAEAALARGRRPAVLLRGYGGVSPAGPAVLRAEAGGGPPWSAPVRDLETGEERPASAWSGARGDEGPMLAARLPGVCVGVHPDREASARRVRAADPGVDLLILDDGFQHGAAARDLDLVMLPAVREPGALRLRPGALREGPEALQRAGAVVVVVDEVDRLDLAHAYRMLNLLDWRGPWALAERRPAALRRWPSGEEADPRALVGRRAVALSGLGDPGGFAATVTAGLGCDLVKHLAHRDHHPFAARDVAELEKWFDRWDADVAVTSEKDAMRLPASWEPPFPLWVVGIDLDVRRGADGLRASLP